MKFNDQISPIQMLTQYISLTPAFFKALAQASIVAPVV